MGAFTSERASDVHRNSRRRSGGRKKKIIVETNIDDLNPQIYEYTAARLFEAGARDVWTTPIYMKKNRPAVQLSALLDEACLDDCVEIIFQETSTIGVRVINADRIAAERKIVAVDTPHGKARAKISSYRGRTVHVSAEYDDCRKIAEQSKAPLKETLRSVVDAARRLLP